MDHSALIIEIGKRAKAKERADAGAPADAPEEGSDEEEGAESVKESAVEDIVSALGLDIKDVDVPALTSALEDFAQACAYAKKGD